MCSQSISRCSPRDFRPIVLHSFSFHFVDSEVVKKSAAAIDSLATFFYVNRQGTLAVYQRMKAFISQPDTFWYSYPFLLVFTCRLLKTLFDCLLFAKSSVQLDLARPLLSVILVNEDGFKKYCQYLCEGCNEVQVNEIAEIFDSITKEMDRSLDLAAKESFGVIISRWTKQLSKYALLRSQQSFCTFCCKLILRMSDLYICHFYHEQHEKR